MRIDHADPYVWIETTSDAEPTMIVPRTQSATTSDRMIVEVGISRRATTTRAGRATDLVAVMGSSLSTSQSPTHHRRRRERRGGGPPSSQLGHREVHAVEDAERECGEEARADPQPHDDRG